MSEISTQILENYEIVKKALSSYPKVKLIAVSKKQKLDKVKVLVDAGHKDFGENYAQEWLDKKDQFPIDLNWHFIGNLQSKKLNGLIKNGIHSIHSLGSLSSIEKFIKLNEKTKATSFIQINIAQEHQKAGITVDELKQLADQSDLTGINGLMTMPPQGLDEKKLRDHFSTLRKLAYNLKLPELSMGMSSDWKIAIEEGATHLRLGTTLFGARDY